MTLPQTSLVGGQTSLAIGQGGGVPANALTSRSGDALTDKSGSTTLTAKAA